MFSWLSNVAKSVGFTSASDVRKEEFEKLRARRFEPTGDFSGLPAEVFNLIIDLAIDITKSWTWVSSQLPKFERGKSPVNLMLVCRSWNWQIRKNNALWKRLYFARANVRHLPKLQKDNMRIRSWFFLLKRKQLASIECDKQDVSFIEVETCDFEFLCPMRWEELGRRVKDVTVDGLSLEVRECSECDRYVYRVEPYLDRQIQTLAKRGECIAIVSSKPSSGFSMNPLGTPAYNSGANLLFQ